MNLKPFCERLWELIVCDLEPGLLFDCMRWLLERKRDEIIIFYVEQKRAIDAYIGFIRWYKSRMIQSPDAAKVIETVGKIDEYAKIHYRAIQEAKGVKK